MEKSQKENRMAYVASGVSFFYKMSGYTDIGVQMALENARLMKIVAKCLGYNPISTPSLYCGVYDEDLEREECLNNGKELMDLCDTFIYDSRMLPVSDGVKAELQYFTDRSSKNGSIKIIDISNLGVFSKATIFNKTMNKEYTAEEIRILEVMTNVVIDSLNIPESQIKEAIGRVSDLTENQYYEFTLGNHIHLTVENCKTSYQLVCETYKPLGKSPMKKWEKKLCKHCEAYGLVQIPSKSALFSEPDMKDSDGNKIVHNVYFKTLLKGMSLSNIIKFLEELRIKIN